MRFSKQEYWSGLPFPSPGNLPDPGIEPGPPVLQYGCNMDSLQLSYEGSPKRPLKGIVMETGEGGHLAQHHRLGWGEKGGRDRTVGTALVPERDPDGRSSTQPLPDRASQLWTMWVTAAALPKLISQMNVNLDEFQIVSSLESGRVPGRFQETGVVRLDTAPDLDEEGGKMMGQTLEESSDLQRVQKCRAGQSLKVHPGKGCPV